MKTNKKGKTVSFSTFEDFLKYYSAPSEEVKISGSKYYQIGINVAKMACETVKKDSGVLV
ncbi:MAG: hypothetical protein ABIH86_02230 [Planctomycetota bacterium]